MSTTPITVRKVESKADSKAFFEFPWTIYKDDPKWVPPLVSIRKKLLDKTKNPSWEYMYGDYFVAWRGDQPVGTIAAFINHRHNQTWNEKIGWFGFFECYDNQEIANALLTTAADYIRAAGDYTGIRGPAQFTCNDEWGLLIENFSQPVMLMPYNHQYYQRLIENSGLGYNKVMDIVSYFANSQILEWDNGRFPEKVKRVVEKTMDRYKITIRKPDPKNLRGELKLLRNVYETAWEKNWGNVPPTDHEMDHLFADLKDYFDPDLAQFAYVDGQLAGFFLCLPDMNQVLKLAYPRPNEPEPITLIKAFWHWKIRPKITQQRVVFLGVKEEYRRLGVDAAMFYSFYKLGIYRKYRDIDMGWVLESNQPMNQLSEVFKVKLYKKYRFYQKALG